MDSETNGVWRTVKGRRIFIKDGQSLSDAMRDSKKFNNLQEKLRNRLNNSSKNDTINLTEEEEYALNKYISSGSYLLNEALRNNIKLTEEQTVIMNNLDNALNKFPNYEGETTRSLDLKGKELLDFINSHSVGNEVVYKAYTSSTAGTRYNEKSTVELHIKSKNGRDIREKNKSEQEILFKRNTKFKVSGIKVINEVYHIRIIEV